MSYPPRTICAVLEDMRNCYKTYNFQAIGSLIEEVQMLANRMEASLENRRDYVYEREKLKEVREEVQSLKRELKLLNKIKENK